MFARQTFRSTAGVLGATVVGGGVAYAGYSYYKGPSPPLLTTAYADAPGPKKAFGGFGGFADLKLESVEVVNHNVKRFRFQLPDPESVSGLATISSVLTKHTPEGAWIPVIRPYTPIITDEPGYITLMVKKYPNGKASGHLHSMSPGQTLSVRGPIPEFPYSPNKHSHITVIAGGSGITPIYQLTRTIFRNPADKTKVTLVYGNNTEQDILLKSEFDTLEKTYPDRFKAIYVVSNPPVISTYEKGYVTKELLQKVMPDPKNETDARVLVSGPPPMCDPVAGKKTLFGWAQGPVGGILAELGYTKQQVYKF